MSGSARVVEYCVLLPHTTQPRLLCLPGEDGWSLPSWRSSTPAYWQTVHHVNEQVRDLFGLGVTTLRCLGTANQPGAGRARRWYELENHSPDAQPIRGTWMGQEVVERLAQPEQRQMAQGWFEECTRGVPARRRSWARHGWYAEAAAWISTHLAVSGSPAVGPVEQLRTWERGCVLRVSTACGRRYFKALPALFAHEIALVEALAHQHPAHLVRLLHSDRDRGWMLMSDLGDHTLDHRSQPVGLEDALRLFAHLQRSTAHQAARWLKLGCPNRDLKWLIGQVDPLFAALPTYPGFEPTEIERIRALADQLKRAAYDLTTCEVPLAIDHGDFHPSNVFVGRGTYVYADWTDSSLAHPFFSAAQFLASLRESASARNATDGHDEHARLRDAYLEAWTGYASGERLRDVFHLADQIMPLHRALAYHTDILPAMEARWEMEYMVSYYLKQLLQ
ncbi:MAG TPA: phosphotransferase [Ktedonobacterales bacterium]